MKYLSQYKIFEKSSLIRLGVPYDVMRHIQREFALPDNINWKPIPLKRNLKIELRKLDDNFFIAISDKEILVLFSIDLKYYINRYYFIGEDDFGGGAWEQDMRKEITITDALNLIDRDFHIYKCLSNDWTYTGKINRTIKKSEVDFADFTAKFKKDFAENFTRIVKKLFSKKSKLIQDVIMTNLLSQKPNFKFNIEKAKEGEFFKKRAQEQDPYRLQLDYIRDNSLTIFNEFLIKFEEVVSQEYKEFLTIPELCKRYGREKIMTAFMYYLFSGKIMNFGEKLNEELIGSFFNSLTKTEEDVYKNPQTIKRMAKWCRAISDEKGNLIVADSTSTIHFFLKDFVNYTGGDFFDDYMLKGKIVTWQRNSMTNEMWLGESYPDKIEPELMEKIRKLTRKAELKNPNVKFILKSINKVWDY